MSSIPAGKTAPIIPFVAPLYRALEPYAYTLIRVSAGAGESLSPVDPSGSGGQYHVVMRGSVMYVEYPLRTLAWVDPEDDPAELVAGPRGAAVLVLQFPVASAVEAAA